MEIYLLIGSQRFDWLTDSVSGFGKLWAWPRQSSFLFWTRYPDATGLGETLRSETNNSLTSYDLGAKGGGVDHQKHADGVRQG